MPKNYLVNTSGNDIVRSLLNMATPETNNELERLIAGEEITKIVRHDVTYGEIDKSVDNIWNVLFTAGYLTTIQSEDMDENQSIQLKILNKEVLDAFIHHVYA